MTDAELKFIKARALNTLHYHPDNVNALDIQALCREIERLRKIIMYRARQYSFPPPPVSPNLWDEQAWVDYIDAHGRWTGE